MNDDIVLFAVVLVAVVMFLILIVVGIGDMQDNNLANSICVYKGYQAGFYDQKLEKVVCSKYFYFDKEEIEKEQ